MYRAMIGSFVHQNIYTCPVHSTIVYVVLTRTFYTHLENRFFVGVNYPYMYHVWLPIRLQAHLFFCGVFCKYCTTEV